MLDLLVSVFNIIAVLVLLTEFIVKQNHRLITLISILTLALTNMLIGSEIVIVILCMINICLHSLLVNLEHN